MSITLARILFTVVCFGSFILFLLITFRKGAKQSYDDVAQEIVDDDDVPNSMSSEDSTTHGNGANK